MIPPPDSRDPPEGPLYFAKKRSPADMSDPPAISSHTRKCLLITHKKMNTALLAGTHHSGRMTCGPTKLTGTEGFVNLVNMNDSSSSDRTMSIQRPLCFFNLWSSCSSRPNQRRLCLVLLPPVAGCAAAEASPPPTIPTTGQALRRRQPYTTAEPVNPRAPLRAGFHCHVFPGSASSPS